MVSIGTQERVDQGSWTLWGHAPVELHDALWGARGVEVVRPGGVARGHGRSRWYLAIGSEDGMVAIDQDELGGARRGVWEIDAVASGFAGYRERIEYVEDRAVRAIRRHYRDAGATPARCYVTTDAQLAFALANGRSLGDSRVESTSGRVAGAVFHGGDSGDVAAWLGTVVDGEIDLSTVVPGLSRWDSSVWASGGSAAPEGVRFVGAVCVGQGVSLPGGSVVIGPAIVPDGWSGGMPVITGEVMHLEPEGVRARRTGRVYAGCKRAIDILVSGVGMVVGMPLFLAIVIGIYLEDGRPVLFRQRRQTRGGREFDCLKFRTMVRDADAMQAELREQMLNEVDGPQFAIKDDPRILRIGRWLRLTQLDELPQLWNVFKGEMSLVGPRPSPEHENRYCPAWREARLSVPAGITGLWQVRRRREPGTDFQEWIRYDIEYADRRGVLLDLRILFETAMLYVPFGKRAKERRRRQEKSS